MGPRLGGAKGLAWLGPPCVEGRRRRPAQVPAISAQDLREGRGSCLG